ncbi:MAG: hypothetical protein HOQ28_00380 [Thermoleophilia bacterium]|nr:hypothetical protein [Thermoleophilia bacterium]
MIRQPSILLTPDVERPPLHQRGEGEEEIGAFSVSRYCWRVRAATVSLLPTLAAKSSKRVTPFRGWAAAMDFAHGLLKATSKFAQPYKPERFR